MDSAVEISGDSISNSRDEQAYFFIPLSSK